MAKGKNESEFFEIDDSGTPVVSEVSDKKNDDPEKSSLVIGDEDVEIIPFSTSTSKPKVKDVSIDDPDEDDDEDDGDDTDAGVDDNETDEEPLDNSSSSQYLAFAKTLFDGGVLTQFDEKEFIDLMKKEGQVKALIELNRQTINEVVSSQFAALPDDYKRLFDAARKGVPLRDAWEIQVTTSDFSKLTDKDLEDDATAKRVITESLRQRNFTTEEINQAIEEAEALDKLTDKAKTAKKFIVDNAAKLEASKIKKAQEDAEALANEEKVKMTKINTIISDFGKVLPNVKLNSKHKTQIVDLLTKPVKQLNNGSWATGVWAKRLEDPEKFDVILAYMVNTGLFDGKLDGLKAPVVSDAAKDFMNLMEKNNPVDSGTPRRVQNTKSKSARNPLESFRIRKNDSY